jgi:hypothetical protein
MSSLCLEGDAALYLPAWNTNMPPMPGDGHGERRAAAGLSSRIGPPSSTPKAEFERFSRPGANVINKLALQRQFFCSGTT